MGRFFQNLKQKTIAGANGPTSTQLQTSGQTIFIDKSNKSELEELILVQKAHYFQTQNGAGLSHPGLSEITTTSIIGIEDYLPIISPVGQEIFKPLAFSVTNGSGSTATWKFGLMDASNNVIDLVAPQSLANGATTINLEIDTYLLDSSMYLVVYSNQDVDVKLATIKLSLR